MKYNVEELLDCIDMTSYADFLGIPRKGVKVLCPAHNDTHFGSAKIWHKGIYCFACSRFITANECTQIIYGVNSSDAYGIMADFAGGRSLFKMNEQTNYYPAKNKTLAIKDLELLGINAQKKYTDNFKESKADAKELLSIQQLAREDYEAYNWLVLSKIREKLEIIEPYILAFDKMAPTENVVLFKKALKDAKKQLLFLRRKMQTT